LGGCGKGANHSGYRGFLKNAILPLQDRQLFAVIESHAEVYKKIPDSQQEWAVVMLDAVDKGLF